MCFTDALFTQSVLPTSLSGLGVYSAKLLALSAFLAAAVSAREAQDQHIGEEFEDKVQLRSGRVVCSNRNLLSTRQRTSEELV